MRFRKKRIYLRRGKSECNYGKFHFFSCLSDGIIEKLIRRDKSQLKAAEGYLLPEVNVKTTVWIGLNLHSEKFIDSSHSI